MEFEREDSDGEGEGFYKRSAKEQEEALTLEGLPYEVGLRVCNYLSPTDLLSLALASSHTHALAADHSLWRERCLSEFRKPNLSPAIRTKIDLTSSTREINWKRFYFQKKVLEQRWTEEKYVIHKIPHEGTTVIQVLRTNKRIYEDDENEAEAEAETQGGMNVDVGEEGEKQSEEAKSEENDGEETRAHQARKSEEEEEEEAAAEAVAKTQSTKRRKSGKQGKSAGSKKDKTKKGNTPMETDSPSDTPAASVDNADADEKAHKQLKKAGRGKKKGRRGAKKGGPAADGDEELVDWGWDFVTGDDEGQVILWSGHEFKEKKTVSAHDFIWWLEVHGDTCITASTDCTAKVIDLSKMEVVRTLKGHPTALWCVDFSIEEDYVVSGGQHGDFIAWRLSDGEKLASHKYGSGLFDVRCVVTDLPIPRSRVRLEGEASDDEDAAAMAEQEDNEAEAEPAAGSSSSASSKLSLSASTGGRSNMQRLAICTAVGEVDFYLYDIDAQQVIGTFSGHRATVTTVKRDSDLVLSGSDDKTIRVWDLATLKCLHTFSVGGIVYDIRLCENKLVAGVTGEQSSFLRVWDYVKRTHMMDIPVSRVPRRIFSITVLPDRIYCSTNEHITVVDFRDVEGVEVMCKPKKSTRSRRGRENCLLQ